jgi:hypothetical protein
VPRPSRQERCGRCRFWDRLDDDLEDVGLCRRYPPVIQGERGHNAEWPETQGEEWCGEWCPPDEPEA